MLKKFFEFKEEISLTGNADVVPPQIGSGSQKKPVENPNQEPPKKKPWKAKKQQIQGFWAGLKPNLPLKMEPIPYDHKGSTILQDGIRITGSKEFIASVLSRLKEFLLYENPNSKLVISYRQQAKSLVQGNRDSYLFYLQVKNRGKGV